MTEEIRAIIAARPESSIQGRAASAAYADALALQEAGVDGYARAARLLAFVDVWHELEAEALEAELLQLA